MWVIACFTEENNVEVVPQSWMKGDEECYWPTISRDRLKKLIETQMEPNKEERNIWKTYKAKRIGKIYDNLQKARQGANRALIRSDIETDVENKKREIKVNKKYLSSASSSESSISSEDDEMPQPPVKQIKKALFPEKKVAAFIKKVKSPLKQPKDFPVGLVQDFRKSPRKSPRKHQKKTMDFENQKYETPRTVASSSIFKTPPTNPPKSSKKQETFEELCLGNQAFVKEIAIEIKSEIEQLKAKVEELCNREAAFHRPTELAQFIKVLPVKSLEELNSLEQSLEDESKETELMSFFTRLGGASAADCCRRVLRASMTDEVACLYSWAGQKGKRVFSTLKLRKTVSKAVLARFSDQTEKHIEGVIKDWLRPSKNRLISKQKRRPVDPVVEEEVDE